LAAAAPVALAAHQVHLAGVVEAVEDSRHPKLPQTSSVEAVRLLHVAEASREESRWPEEAGILVVDRPLWIVCDAVDRC
jgi:hypothetical protein